MTPISIFLLLLPAFMVAAAVFDLLTMRIPNWVVLALAGAFFVAALLAGLPLEAIGFHFGLSLVVLAVTFGMFAAGWIGGGDAKFAAATVLWVGPALTLPYLLYAALLGGALTLVLLLARRWPLPLALTRVIWIERLHDAKTGVPYGIALAAAGLLVYPQTVIFSLLSA